MRFESYCGELCKNNKVSYGFKSLWNIANDDFVLNIVASGHHRAALAFHKMFPCMFH